MPIESDAADGARNGRRADLVELSQRGSHVKVGDSEGRTLIVLGQVRDVFQGSWESFSGRAGGARE